MAKVKKDRELNEEEERKMENVSLNYFTIQLKCGIYKLLNSIVHPNNFLTK